MQTNVEDLLLRKNLNFAGIAKKAACIGGNYTAAGDGAAYLCSGCRCFLLAGGG